MAVRTGDRHEKPAERWRSPTYAEEVARESASRSQPERRGTDLGNAVHPTPQQPREEYVLVRVPRSLLAQLIHQEYTMNTASNAAQTTDTTAASIPAAADSLEGLRAARAENESAQAANATAGAELKAQGKQLDEQIATLAKAQSPRNVAKTVGKVAGVTAIVGLVAAGAVFGFKWWQARNA